MKIATLLTLWYLFHQLDFLLIWWCWFNCVGYTTSSVRM